MKKKGKKGRNKAISKKKHSFHPGGNIILIGFKGSGKTSIGKGIARLLNKRFIDLDDVIRAMHRELKGTRLTIREIYQNHGRKYFREKEQHAIIKLKGHKNIVLATGGGAPVLRKSRHELRKLGTIIFLDVHPKAIYQRMLKRGIPPIIDRKNPLSSFLKLFNERKTIYNKLADIRVSLKNGPLGKNIAKAVNEIRRLERLEK